MSTLASISSSRLQMTHTNLKVCSRSDASRLWLPTEIVEEIIHSLWYNTGLSSNERLGIFCALRLVNYTWWQIFMRFACRDVYIPSPTFAEYYLRHLNTQVQDKSCCSITFRVEPSLGRRKSNLKTGEENAKAISTVLYNAELFDYLPSLRRVTIEYVNTDLHDLHDQARLISMPKEVTHLEIKYTSASEECYDKMIFPDRTQLPGITKLTLAGIPALELPVLVGLCPNVEELVIEDLMDSYPPQLTKIIPDYMIHFPGLAGASATRLALHVMFTCAENFGDNVGMKKSIQLCSSDIDYKDPEYKEIQELCRRYNVTLSLFPSS